MTVKAYERHIKEFIKAMTQASNFTQDDIDDYFAAKVAADVAKPPEKQESKSNKGQRKAALQFYLKDCLNLNIEFKDYSTKSSK